MLISLIEEDEDREMLLMEDGVANDVDLSLQLESPVGNDQAGPVMQNVDGVLVVAQGHGLQHDEEGGGDVLGPHAGFGLAAQLAAVGLAISVSDLEFSSGGSFGSASATGSGGSVGSGR